MKRHLIVFLALGVAATAGAYDWPAADMTVVKTFGQATGGKPLAGVEVQTLQPVLAAPDDGDVVFVFRPTGQGVQNLPSSLGGFVALAHADNLRTVTTRIEPLASRTKRTFRRGEPLGEAQVSTGAAESRHRLFVFDQQLGELVNPLLVFPALEDTKAPLFFDVKLFPEGNAAPVSLFGQSNLAVGYWNLHIEVADPVGASKDRTAEGLRGVYAVEAYLNGTEVFNTPLDSFQEKNGRWQVKGLGTFLDEVLVQDQEWSLGQIFLNQGTNILEIVVKDFQGNQAGKTFRILGSRP